MSFGIVIGPRVRKSPFYEATVAAGVQSFTIYNHMYLPISYGDPAAEYQRLTEGVSLWDVAAQRQVEVRGPDAERLVRRLTPRELKRVEAGRCFYVPMCDHDGVLINDPVLLVLAEDRYWLSIADGDMLFWVQAVAREGGYDVEVCEPDVSPLAIQGPKAADVMRDLFGGWVDEIKPFRFREARLNGMPLVISRTGWSKQGGYELFLQDSTRGLELWERLFDAGRPYGIGPGAPNYVERVESALLSYRADTDEDTDPLEAGLERFVNLERDDDFIGKQALKRRAQNPTRKLQGVVLDGSPIGPNQHPWPLSLDGERVGEVRAAAYSPRLERNLGLAMLSLAAGKSDREMDADSETGPRKAWVTPLPFIGG